MGEYKDMAGFPYVMLPNLCEMQMRVTHIKGMIFQYLGEKASSNDLGEL